jgi:endonuclease/exonuclease/phosphatase family metal-dependent hydrolase
MMLGKVALLVLSTISPLCTSVQRTTSGSSPDPASRQKESQGNTDSHLLEVGKALKLRKVGPEPAELKVIYYNIRWRSGEQLSKLIELFRDDAEIGNAAILGLQEVDRKKKRSGSTNTVKLIADELGLHYAWAAPPSPKPDGEEETGVAILSLFPLSDVQRIVLPNEGPNHRRRVALGATVRVGEISLRVYSVHAETRIPLDQKIEQLDAVLQDLAHYPRQMPAIVLGDFNTWEADAERKTKKLFDNADFQTPFHNEATFSRRVLFLPIEIKLDWVWLRGLQFSSYGIDREIGISDHWPLWTTLKLPNEKKKSLQ